MFERFTGEARSVVTQAREEVAALGGGEVEAEHILLALSMEGSGRAQVVLGSVGLDHDGVLAALDAERTQALAAVGVSAPDLEPPGADRRGPVGFGASAKRVLERAVRAAVTCHDRSILAEHLLLGVLAAETGTVPRALAAAGIDRRELIARVDGEEGSRSAA